jgi:putative PIN family toxin of toxin-antitoxin system
MRVVLDTNVLVAGIRSSRGASREILLLVEAGALTPIMSVPLAFEYEAVLKRSKLLEDTGLSINDVDDFLDYFFSKALRQRIDYLWRPWLTDSKDDLVLECAVNSGAFAIVTFNIGHFAQVPKHFGILVLTPREFLMSSEVFRNE